MLLELLELAGNRALAHDPVAHARLQKLQGKTMALHIKPIGQSILVAPFPEGLEFSSSIPDTVDVSLTATVSAMIKISRDGMQEAELKQGELEIVGDPIIGQRFAQVIAELDINWEALLAEEIGDSPARYAALAAAQIKGFTIESRSRFKQFVHKLLTEDLGLIANKDEVEPFLDDVDTLRADTDRLAARVKRLQSKNI